MIAGAAQADVGVLVISARKVCLIMIKIRKFINLNFNYFYFFKKKRVNLKQDLKKMDKPKNTQC